MREERSIGADLLDEKADSRFGNRGRGKGLGDRGWNGGVSGSSDGGWDTALGLLVSRHRRA